MVDISIIEQTNGYNINVDSDGDDDDDDYFNMIMMMMIIIMMMILTRVGCSQ